MSLKVGECSAVYAYKSAVPLFKTNNIIRKQVVCSGKSMIKNGKFNPLQIAAIKLADAATSIFANHSKIGEKVLALSEKILKNAYALK